jgi:hypothetical protein
MSRSRSPLRTLAAFVGGLALALVIVFAADAAYGRRPAATPDLTDPPVTTPTATPAGPTPSVEPTTAPSDPPTTGDLAVALENLTGHDVSLVIDDATGKIRLAASGIPGDGMSVRWFDVKVENIDADTLRIVWVGLPRDEIVRLGVSEVDGQVRLRFVQDAPPANSDAVGFDRILELSFDEPVRSEDVLPSIQESLDTQD